MARELPIVRLGDVAQVNPRRRLAKGAEAPYVAMADLQSNRRRIARCGRRQYRSGPKFVNGDTLMARITPCLENGKIALVNMLDEDQVAQGSTEFIVLAAEPTETDSRFLYYLATSSALREYAIPRMTGTSGRQRVAASDIADFRFRCPTLEEQRRASRVLSSIDERIEYHDGLIELSYRFADTLYEEYATRARVDQVLLGDVIDLEKGVSYKGRHVVDNGSGRPLVNLGNFGRERAPRWDKLKRYDGPVKDRHRVDPGTVVVCATDMTSDRVVLGKALVVPDGLDGAAITHHLYAVRWKNGRSLPPSVIALALNHEPSRRTAASFANGTTVLALPRDAILRLSVPQVDGEQGSAFSRAVEGFQRTVDASTAEIETLVDLRKKLLERLISSRVRAS